MKSERDEAMIVIYNADCPTIKMLLRDLSVNLQFVFECFFERKREVKP
jgi:hypothetical protein